MRFANVNGEKREAERGLTGLCIGCEGPMSPVCGLKKVKHWRHKVDCQCDHWWENETEWHRRWKSCFPTEYQEIRHQADDGEWHIADVKTAQGWVLEFQNSPISIEERDARNAFYRTIVWIVNGAVQKRDRAQFFKALDQGIVVCDNSKVVRVFSSESSLIEKWYGCHVPVFFDFGEDSLLWCLFPSKSDHWRFLTPIRREDFVEWHQGGHDQLQKFIAFLQIFGKVISAYAAHIQMQRQFDLRRQIIAMPLTRYQRYLSRRRSFRRL